MTLKALCVTLGLLGLLSGDAIASPFNDGDEWLRSLGLEQYEAAFRDNAITETLLRHDRVRAFGEQVCASL